MDDDSKLQFMDGTASQKSYLIVGRRDDIALGFKFHGIVDGKMLKVPGKVYLSGRLRSARVKDEDDGSGIVKFPSQLSLKEAWPKLQFSKLPETGNERASTAVGLFLRGSLETDAQAVIAQLESGEPFHRLATYILDAAAEHAVLTTRELANWMRERLQPMLAKKKQELAMQAAFDAEIESEIGVPGLQEVQLKNIYEKLHKHDPEAEIPDESDLDAAG